MSEVLQELIRALESEDWSLARAKIEETREKASRGDLCAAVALELAKVLVRR